MDLVHFRTYAAVKQDGRKETRDEVIDRVRQMHQTKFPWYAEEIARAFEPVYAGRVVPSMRSMQFAGIPIFRSNARIFNCAYAALSSWRDFSDLFWLLMNGVGTGYSVQARYISQLPIVVGQPGETFQVADTKEGWADAVYSILSNPYTELDTSLIRPKGAALSTGGECSGPESLLEMAVNVKRILLGALGRQITELEAFDIMCYLADIVVVGSVRRAATIALFDAEDKSMLTAKHNDWYVDNPQRARANISAVLHRQDADFDVKLEGILQKCFDSNCGEPGVVLTSDWEYGYNPCLEISLRNHGLCNLTEVNAAACANYAEFLDAVASATILGTLQASYTDFQYLQPAWRINAEEEALLGVSITGQAEAWSLLTDSNLEGAARSARVVNQMWARKLEINEAARLTCTKPSGSTSAWWGTTSGVHAAHSPYHLRRVRVDRKDEFGKYLIKTYGEQTANSSSFVETDQFNAENIILTMPISTGGAIQRQSESAIDLMERARHVYKNWICNGHVTGPNTHNVSLTVSYRPDEQNEITRWMIDNKGSWAGISLLPYDGGSYVQAPFEEITAQEFDEWLRKIPEAIDFSQIDFSDYVDRRATELACSGGACEIV